MQLDRTNQNPVTVRLITLINEVHGKGGAKAFSKHLCPKWGRRLENLGVSVLPVNATLHMTPAASPPPPHPSPPN